MKKLLSLVLALALSICALAFTLTSCNEKEDPTTPADGGTTPPDTVATLAGQTPEQLYNKALAEIMELENYTSNSSQIINMNVSGYDMRTTQSVYSKVNGKMNQAASITSEIEMLYGERWMDVDSSYQIIYIVDGYAYVNDGEHKLKAEITEEKMNTLLPEGSSSGAMVMLPSSFFEGTSFKANSDGTFSIVVTMSGEKYAEYFGNLVQNLGAEVEFKSIVHSINFTSEGKLIDIVSDMDYSVLVDDVRADATAVSTTTITNIGTTIPVTAPDDADSYTLGTI